MAVSKYELMKCESCGKTLGYAYVTATISFLGMIATQRWPPPGPQSSQLDRLSVTAFCESCFQGRLGEIYKGKPEPKTETDNDLEPRTKSKGRPLVR